MRTQRQKLEALYRRRLEVNDWQLAFCTAATWTKRMLLLGLVAFALALDLARLLKTMYAGLAIMIVIIVMRAALICLAWWLDCRIRAQGSEDREQH